MQKLQDLLRQRGIVFEDARWEQLHRYLDLLLRWNRQVNLVSRADIARLVSRHVTESVGLLLVCAPPANTMAMDVGSGGGFPGVAMKIFRPDLELTLVEATGKRARFLKTVGIELGLDRFDVRHRRVESIKPDELAPQALITVRAVAELAKLWKWTNHLLAGNGRLCALKGGEVQAELARLAAQKEQVQISIEHLPVWLGIDPSRFVVIVQRKGKAGHGQASV